MDWGGGHRDHSPGLGVGRGIREGGGVLCEVLGASLWPQFLYHVLPGVSTAAPCSLKLMHVPVPRGTLNGEQGLSFTIC